MNNFFLIVVILIAAISAGRILRLYHRVSEQGGFTDQEKAVLRWQWLALIVLLPFLPLAVYGVVFRGSRWVMITYLAVSSVILTYAAISSIINRVTILPARHWQRVPKGKPAAFTGIFYMVILVIAWVVVLFTDFLQLVGFQ
jgi:hypothetical protein